MKKFKSKKNYINKIDLIVIIISLMTLVLLHYYNKCISYKLEDIITTKIEMINTSIIKANLNPQMDIDKLVNVYKNKNNEIISVDINTMYANNILDSVVSDMDKKLKRFNNNYNEKDLINYNNIQYILVPIGLSNNGNVFNNYGPKIPVSIYFNENILGKIETSVSAYGINNSLMKVNMIIKLEQKMLLPYKEKKLKREFSINLLTKVISGSIPDYYGGVITNNRELVL